MKVNKTNVLSVIESHNGIVDSITSFIIPENGMKLNESEQLKSAEMLFLKRCRNKNSNNMDYSDEELLDEGNYTSPITNNSVSLVWSENVYS